MTIRFLASNDPEIREVQAALVQTWGYVSTQYLDPNFNGVDWPRELQENLDKTFEAKSPDEVYTVMSAMVSKLGDPFTRVLPPKQAAAFKNATEGEFVGLGFQVSEDSAGVVRIAFVATGSPAERGGISVGDRLLSVNGRSIDEWDKQKLAAALRTEADVVIQRGNSTSAKEKLHLLAEPIEVHPVQYAALPAGDTGQKAGYIRLTAYSQNAVKDFAEAIQDLQKDKVSSLVLDLRDNVGGVVYAGYRVAQMLLPDGAPFCHVEDGRGATEDVALVGSQPLANEPLAVLVNGGTASTSELVAAALRDDHRAVLIGEKTFGKGRTQRVVPLKGGGILLLSNTKYWTPNRAEVDKVGLTPDTACKPEFTDTSYWNSGDQTGGSLETSLLKDPCIEMAIKQLSTS